MSFYVCRSGKKSGISITGHATRLPYTILIKAGPAYMLVLLCILMIVAGCGTEKKETGRSDWSDEGVLVYRLGTDTVGYQYFRINNDSLQLRTVYFPGGYQYKLTKAVLNDTGKIREAVTTIERKDNDQRRPTQVTVQEVATMSVVTSMAGPEKFTDGFAGLAFAVSNAGPATDYFFPALARFANTDSTKGLQFAFGKSRPFWLLRVTDNLVYAGGDLIGKVKLRVDSANHLLSLDASESPLHVKAEVYRNWDFDSLLTSVRQRPELMTMPELSPVSKTIYHLPGLDVMLNYSMPSKRGRQVFGKVVSYQYPWRMGANRATEITFSEPVYFNRRKLAAGTYTLFALMAPASGVLIVNDQSGIWGTDHNTNWDGLRINFTMEKPGTLREQLKIEVLKTANGRYRLQMEWDETRAYVEFGMQPFDDPAMDGGSDDDPDDEA